MTEQLVLIAFTILIPLTPAYILYRALPSEALVSGPLQGFNIQLKGAFAGYFALVLLIFGFLWSQPKKSQYEVWRVRGQLTAEPGNSIKDGASLSLLPPNFNIDTDGRFDFTIATKPGLDGNLEFPKLHIEHPDYQSVDIDLNELKPKYGGGSCSISKSEKQKALNLENSVVLKKKDTGQQSNYDSSKGQTATPVGAPPISLSPASGSEVTR